MPELKPVGEIPEDQRLANRQELGGSAPSIYCEVCHDSGHGTLEHPYRSDWESVGEEQSEAFRIVSYLPDGEDVQIVVERHDEQDWDSPDVCGRCYKPSSMIHPDHDFEEMMVPETIPGWKVYDDDDPAETTTYFRGFDQALREGERLMAFALENA